MRRRLIFLVALVLVALLLVASGWPHEIYMRSRAARLITQIESYRAAHGDYPISLADLGLSDANGPIYYQRDFDSSLVCHVWFGTGVGTASQYDSKTRTWRGPQ